MTTYSLAGRWQADIGSGNYPINLPGTLDENGIGSPDQGLNQWHADLNPEAFKANEPILTR